MKNIETLKQKKKNDEKHWDIETEGAKKEKNKNKIKNVVFFSFSLINHQEKYFCKKKYFGLALST